MAVNLIIIALIQTLNRGYIRLLFSTAINNRQLINNLRENLNLGKLTSILLNLPYFNCLAVIVWMAMKSNADYLVVIISLILIGMALFKLFVIRIISVLSNTKIGLQEHLLNHLIFFQVGGIVLTPILIFTHYIPERYVNLLLISLVSIVGLFIIVRELQSLTRAVQYKVSIFYIILYLCTLEILPFIVGFRVFILNSGVLN